MSELCPVCKSPVDESDTSCPCCGFKLLGATQKFVPVAMDTNEETHVSSAPFKAALLVVRGPQTGASYEISGDELTIGRSPQCTIFLNDMTVSRMHAKLTREEDSYVIVDENSFNGVWVNNQDVQMKTLSSGDFIQIGSFCLMYEEKKD